MQRRVVVWVLCGSYERKWFVERQLNDFCNIEGEQVASRKPWWRGWAWQWPLIMSCLDDTLYWADFRLEIYVRNVVRAIRMAPRNEETALAALQHVASKLSRKHTQHSGTTH